MEENRITLSAEQARRRRRRSIAIALVLAGLAILFYALAVLRGPGVLDRPI
jgi:hypothetical protein